MKNNWFYLILLFVAAWFILSPFYNFEVQIGQGDNGRDYYAYQQTAGGATPYQDYWWVYGPLMPYYYAAFISICGPTIKSIFLGKLFLKFLSSIFIFFIIRHFGSALFAFTAAVWFLIFQPDFSYTYNHVGGITLVMAMILLAIKYIHQPKRIYLFSGIALAYLLCLVKVNIGLAAFAAFTLSIFLFDLFRDKRTLKRNIIFWGVSGAILATAVLATYALFLNGLPTYSIRQCLPYLSEDNPTHAHITQTLPMYIWINIRNVFAAPTNIILAIFINLSFLQTMYTLLNKKKGKEQDLRLFFSLITLFIFLLCLLHEFLTSGVPYRLFWVSSIQFLFIFIFLSVGTRDLKPVIRNLVMAAFLCIGFYYTFNNQQFIKLFKVPSRFLAQPAGQVYVQNEPKWMDTVNQTVKFLNNNLKSGEHFLALPYDPLYYYLTERKSPTQLLIFFKHINVPTEQEINIMNDLEQNNTRYIVISNRSEAHLDSLGYFGKDYCPLLYKYVQENYTLVAAFGNWNEPAEALTNHAARILERK